jgi:hypothetical protein
MRIMKILSLVLFLLTIVAPSTSYASDMDEVIAAINGTMPHDWQIQKDFENRPWWIRTDNTCTKLLLYGPSLGGYRYLDKSSRIIVEERDTHEAITVWVTPKGFKTGWNPLTRLMNWFAPWGIVVPKQIADYNGVRVYAEESYYDPQEKWKKDSPKGTATAVFCPPPNGRTWQSWQTDIQQVIEKLTPTSR